MVESAPAQAAAPAKAAKKKVVAKPKPKNAGSSVTELIVKSVAASKERSGVSAAAVKKALTAGGYDVEKNNSRVNTAIKNLVNKGTLVQTKGTGASGSFKISKQAAENPAKKVAPAAKKPTVAKKPKAVAAKKSPKKAKKTAAAKKSAAAKSPKKAAKSPKKPTKSPKKVARKAPTARKTPAKKAAKPKAKKAAPKKT